MARGKGKAFLVKIGDGEVAEAFTTIGMQKTAALEINNSEVDVTTKDSAGWRELAGDQAIKSVQMTADGIADSGAAWTELVAIARKTADVELGPVANFQLIEPITGETLEGEFLISSFQETGEHENAITYSLTLTSTGAVTWT